MSVLVEVGMLSLSRYAESLCSVAAVEPLLSLRGLVSAELFFDMTFLATVAFCGKAFAGDFFFGAMLRFETIRGCEELTCAVEVRSL